MGVTLCHLSALDVVRILRAESVELSELDTAQLAKPSTWTSKRWCAREFAKNVWRWPQPSQAQHLHILIGNRNDRVRLSTVDSHIITRKLPNGSILRVDANTCIVCPELLFAQLAEVFSLPTLVMLGYELCGHFSRNALDPLNGNVTMELSPVTSVDDIRGYLALVPGLRGVMLAREALRYVCDHAVSPPEALLATMYSLPFEESGYGLGPVTLNDKVDVSDADGSAPRFRYPDLQFSFAPLGINYDGEEDHLDLDGLIKAAQHVCSADAKDVEEARRDLAAKYEQVRGKVVDDKLRNAQLASSGKIIFPATKEDLSDGESLDRFTRLLLGCASTVFGVDTTEWIQRLDNTEEKRDRNALLRELSPGGMPRGASHGVL